MFGRGVLYYPNNEIAYDENGKMINYQARALSTTRKSYLCTARLTIRTGKGSMTTGSNTRGLLAMTARMDKEDSTSPMAKSSREPLRMTWCQEKES